MVTSFLTQHHHHPQNHHFLPPKRHLLTCALYALLPLALLHYFLFYPPHHQEAATITRTHEHLPSPPPSRAGEAPTLPACDYADGEWVPEARPPLYNGTSCGAIKDGQNCMAHGRPDTGYLHWRWRPRRCRLPAFSPRAFLRWLRGRHLAFVGDSMARNQAESLLCLLASASPPRLVHRDGDEGKFRRWVFPAHNATVSIFWSPFLVKVAEKSEPAGVRHNNVFLDSFDERWMSQLGALDAIVLSVGHWFLIPSIYHDGGEVIGCHHCPEHNQTEIGFFGVFRAALRRTLAEVSRRHGAGEKAVAVATFSPAHFQGEWDKAGACPKKEPYNVGEAELGYTETELRKTVLEEVAVAAAAAGNANAGLRFTALDITKLASLRPDGHPGPYMYNDPFAGGARERVQNDCVHWCLPGPIDTFNEILQQIMTR